MSVEQLHTRPPLPAHLASQAAAAMRSLIFLLVTVAALLVALTVRDQLWHALLVAGLTLLAIALLAVAVWAGRDLFRGP
jgi:protein-S-isoprenylcysteine O-methyltransferase Ste14